VKDLLSFTFFYV